MFIAGIYIGAHEVKDFVLLIVPSCAAQHLEKLGVHLFPFRTEKLSPSTLMVLG
jgi:hypothetical protein